MKFGKLLIALANSQQKLEILIQLNLMNITNYIEEIKSSKIIKIKQ